MKSFDFFDHDSDVGVSIIADTLEELFVSSAEALFSLIAAKKSIGKNISFKTDIAGDTIEELLVNWLNELIFGFETKEFYGQKFDLKISDKMSNGEKKYFLKADIAGEKIDLKKDEILHEVKSATYHQLKVEEKDGKHTVKIIFDL